MRPISNPTNRAFCVDMALVIDDAVIMNQRRNLEAAMTTNPKMAEALRKGIRSALLEARRQMIGRVPIENDPRGAAQGIRTSVYKKILGGQINLLPSKKRHAPISYEPPRTLTPGQRGGNRMKRGARTKQIMSYGPLDRQFILRFVNSGTKQRVIGFRNDKKGNRARYDRLINRINAGDKARTGNRGFISPRNWFGQSAESELGQAAQNIANIIESEWENIMNASN